MDTLAFLKAKYREATTERARAAIELEAWNLSPSKKDSYHRGDYIRNALGLTDTGFDIEQRLQLVGYGDVAGPLWERVDQDMVPRTALELIRSAKMTRQAPETPEQAVARVMAEYDSRPFARNLKKGKVVRQRSGASVMRQASVRDARVRKNSAASEPPEALTTRQFWNELRALVGTFMREQLKGHDEAIAMHEQQRLERDIQLVLNDVQTRLTRIRSRGGTASMTDAIVKRRLTQACGILRLTPPKDGTITEAFLKSARRNFRQLAREYHPDTAGDATRSQYESVVEAWQTVQDCHEQQCTGKPPG